MPTALYWGDNGAHEFWESEDNELLILRNSRESFWSAHRNYGFLFSCNSAEEGAHRVGAELSNERVWKKATGGKYALVAAAEETFSRRSNQTI